MGRLFWKIFAWFWLALALISLSVGWGVKLYVEQHSSLPRGYPQAQVRAIAHAFEQGDMEQARNLLDSLSHTGRFPIFSLDSQGGEMLDRDLPHFLTGESRQKALKSDRLLVREVVTPGGERFQIVALRTPTFPRLSKAPGWLSLSIALLISTLVCFWLARYLARPISRLRDATRRLSAGNLDVRVGGFGCRKDEIADLAADFDTMADRIQQLLQAQRQLLQDISHELRSPLARLQVALALARRRDTGDSAQLDRIERDIQRLEELVGEVLTLSRLESIADANLNEPIDLKALIGDIAQDNTLEATQKQCRLTLDLEDNGRLIGSTELMRRAVENLVRNAIKYSHDDSEITITLRRRNGALQLEVCDSGPGVAEDALHRLFEPFVRTDSARERNTGGFGLGLAIARRAIELHRGTVTAFNRHDRSGLCVIANFHSPAQDNS